MKKIICVLPLLAIGLTPALANSDSLKIKTVENMYNTVIEANRRDQDIDTLRTLFSVSDQSLQNAITLAKFGRLDDGGDMTICHSAFETLVLNPSNGMFLHEIEDISYRTLNDGKVRASILYYDDVVGIKDFSLKCNSNSCKVADVFDSDGASSKHKSERLCR